MASFIRRLATAAILAAVIPVAVSAEPLNVVRAPAKDEAPARVEAAMFDIDASLADSGKLSGLLLQSGIDQDEALSASALAQTQVADGAPLRVKLGLSRDPDTGAIAVQRLVVSTAARVTTIEQREGKLRVVSSAARKYRIV